jgi:Rrf2 family transcriptional regulator, cysteine metabolism repressor
MKLSTRTEYGIRALFELAIAYKTGPLMVKDIAKRTKISPKYIEQIICFLRREEIVVSKRGPYGGYTLAKPPEMINLSKAFAVLEGSITRFDCPVHKTHNSHCADCFMKSLWHRMEEALNSVIATTTLAEMPAKSTRAR